MLASTAVPGLEIPGLVTALAASPPVDGQNRRASRRPARGRGSPAFAARDFPRSRIPHSARSPWPFGLSIRT